MILITYTDETTGDAKTVTVDTTPEAFGELVNTVYASVLDGDYNVDDPNTDAHPCTDALFALRSTIARLEAS